MKESLTIWNYENYKKYIRDYFKTLDKSGRGQLGKLAKSLSVHSTYVSQVINGPKDFSSEQAIKVSEFLNLTGREQKYFLELLFYAKAGNASLKEFHFNRMSELKDEANKIVNRVGKSTELSDEQKIKYYSDWSYVATWLAVSIDKIDNADSLATFLNLSKNQVDEILKFLLEVGLCEVIKGKIVMKVKKTHIPSHSTLVKNHHLNWRLKSIESCQKLTKQELMFTAPISISRKDFEIVKNMILKLIEEISKIVKETNPEIIACLNFDQFIVNRNTH